MTLDLELLDRPPAEGARTVALALLADVTDAAARVGDPSDGDALHDFRVALRRLRSTLRAWRPVLGDSLRKKDGRRLREVARATGPARDAEVLAAWLAKVKGDLPERYHPALDWMAARVERRLRGTHAEPATEAAARMRQLEPGMAHRLASAGDTEKPGHETFAAALAALLRAHAKALREALGQVSGTDDVAPAHVARMEVKRLRYLLEPLRGTPQADATAPVKGLKTLQDLLGEHHDAHVAAAETGAARAAAAAERVRGQGPAGAHGQGPGLRPGLLALERIAARRGDELFARLEADVLRDRAQPLLDQVYAVVAGLEARAGGASGLDEKPRRRFLLLRLPEPARWGESAEVEKGWLPGDRVRECFGVGRSRLGESFFRAVSSGTGTRRAEASEEISREVFEDFWPLTEGRRVHKRCHLPPSEPGWRFDEYLDRSLVLAVAELGNDGGPPEWLDPYVVREVTAERGYQDDALARRPARKAGARAEAEAPAAARGAAADAADGGSGDPAAGGREGEDGGEATTTEAPGDAPAAEGSGGEPGVAPV